MCLNCAIKTSKFGPTTCQGLLLRLRVTRTHSAGPVDWQGNPTGKDRPEAHFLRMTHEHFLVHLHYPGQGSPLWIQILSGTDFRDAVAFKEHQIPCVPSLSWRAMLGCSSHQEYSPLWWPLPLLPATVSWYPIPALSKQTRAKMKTGMVS
jgi:hypothetical protein